MGWLVDGLKGKRCLMGAGGRARCLSLRGDLGKQSDWGFSTCYN